MTHGNGLVDPVGDVVGTDQDDGDVGLGDHAQRGGELHVQARGLGADDRDVGQADRSSAQRRDSVGNDRADWLTTKLAEARTTLDERQSAMIALHRRVNAAEIEHQKRLAEELAAIGEMADQTIGTLRAEAAERNATITRLQDGLNLCIETYDGAREMVAGLDSRDQEQPTAGLGGEQR